MLNTQIQVPAQQKDDSVLNFFMALLMTFFAIHYYKAIFTPSKKYFKSKELKDKMKGAFLIAFGTVFYILFKVLMHIFTEWGRNKINQAERWSMIEKVDPVKQPSFENVEQNICYDRNKDSMKKIYNSVIFASQLDANFVVFLNGSPGVGKTDLMRNILKNSPNGGLIIKLSAFIKYEDFRKVNISTEITQFNKILEDAKKKKMILVFDECELLIQDREQTDDIEENTSEAIQEKEAFNLIVGVWKNYWLSVISNTQLPMVLISNEGHSMKNIIDSSNSRRITLFETIYLPDKQERLLIFKKYIKGVDENILETIAKHTHGLSGREIKAICQKTIKAEKKISIKVFFNFVADFIRSMNQKQQQIYNERNTVYFSEIIKSNHFNS